MFSRCVNNTVDGREMQDEAKTIYDTTHILINSFANLLQFPDRRRRFFPQTTNGHHLFGHALKSLDCGENKIPCSNRTKRKDHIKKR